MATTRGLQLDLRAFSCFGFGLVTTIILWLASAFATMMLKLDGWY
jgi:hypothetical protein